jgi:tetratricopeptide (TPR) repeat protein
MKKRICLWIGGVALAVLTAGAGSLRAAEDPALAAANQAYAEGRFQEAVDGYQSLVQSGRWSANLFYDLGNSWFRLGDFGKAILNYERALALESHHPEAEANLRLARDEARALELRKDWMDRYVATATSTQYSVAAAVAFWFALFAGTRLFFSPRRSAGQIALIVLALIVCGTSVFALYTMENGTRGNALAIVTGKDVEARLATADNASSVLALPPGSEIKVLSERGDWIYAALPNDQRGWIPAKSAEKVRLDTPSS